MSLPVTATVSPTDAFSSLPPEMLHKIWRNPELKISPSATPINTTLLSYARQAAYRDLVVDSDITLAALGETLKRSPHLGELVDCITLNEERDVATGMAHDEIWLEESFVRAFEGLTHVKTIRIHRTDLHVLLSHRILQTAAFKSATKLVLSSPNNIPYSALRHLHYSSSLRTLCVLSPMKYEAANGPPSLFAGVSSGITKVKMSSEPHAREYASFFGHCNNLEELDIRSGTTDVAFVFASLADTTKASLRALAFSSQGYLSCNIDTALIGLSSLERLTLWGCQFEISPFFFSTLAALPLVSLMFRGPRNPLLGHLIDFLQSSERPATLGEVGVDVAVGNSRGGGETPLWSAWRSEEEIKMLSTVCQQCGLKLAGSICDALKLLPVQRAVM